MLKPLEDVMANAIAWLYGVTNDYTLAIVLLTVAIRVLIAPLFMVQMKSMKKMQELQPKIKELQTKYKDDPQKMNQEMMEIYRSNKVNPLSGCLPLLIQMPFLIAIFRVLLDYSYVDAMGQVIDPTLFGWERIVLNQPDPTYILPILSGVATFLQSWLSTGGTGGDTNMKMMTYVMPVFIAWITTQYPAGLALYWLVTQLVGIVQQAIYPGFKPLKPRGEAAAK